MSTIEPGGPAFPMQEPQAIHAYAIAAVDGITDPEERDRAYLKARAEAVGGATLRDHFATHCGARGDLREERRHPLDLLPAAAHLPRKATVTRNVAQQGGQSWSCQADGCRAYDSIARYDAAARGVIMGPVSEGAWDGVLAIGPVTASPPMAHEPDQPAAISSGSSS